MLHSERKQVKEVLDKLKEGCGCSGRYSLCGDQDAQIECHISACMYNENKKCSNISPALVLNEDNSCICWSRKEEEV